MESDGEIWNSKETNLAGYDTNSRVRSLNKLWDAFEIKYKDW